jgi:hypothetical protein
VCGDSNTRYTRAEDNIRLLGTANGMKDPWVELALSGTPPPAGSEALLCDNPSLTTTCEIVDKCFYRGSPLINLSATKFDYVGRDFLQANGSILSDHDPVKVDLRWSLAATRRQSDYFGGASGTHFNDVTRLSGSPKASVLTFRGAERLDGVGLQLADGTVFSHGGSGGTAASLSLGATEYWTSAVLCRGAYNNGMRIFYIKATTSGGRNVEAGTATSDCQTSDAPSGWQIVGYMGRAGDEVDQLAFIYAPQ